MKKNFPVTQTEIKLGENEMIISVTDLKGQITYVNEEFKRISGYNEKELIGTNHNIVRHPDMPPVAFQDLWDTVKRGESWSGIVKNRCKNGDHYWVDAFVTPIFDGDTITGYQSVRTRPTEEQVRSAEALYQKLNSTPSITKLPRNKSIMDISIRPRIFASLSLILILALSVALLAYIDLGAIAERIAEHHNYEQTFVQSGNEFFTAWKNGAISEDKIEAFHALLQRHGSDESNIFRYEALYNRIITTQYWIIGICIIGIISILVIGSLLSRTVIEPMKHVNIIAKGIAGGNLLNKIEIRHQDEIGRMMQSMKLMQARLRTILGRVAEDTATLVMASEQVDQSTKATLQSMEQQQMETNSAATAMNQMSATIQEVAKHAEDAAEAARHAASQANDGKTTMVSTKKSLDQLLGDIHTSGEAIDFLQQQTNEINNILSTINDIAEQTNLLALNAAIEAARAGEQGRGFAVVADEVRTLAQRTQASTSQISGVIDKVNDGVTRAATAMSSSREQASHVVEEAAKSEEALNQIAAAGENITQMSGQIAHSTSQQGEVAEEMNMKLTAINSGSVEATERSTEVDENSQKLKEMAAHLKELITQFKLM